MTAPSAGDPLLGRTLGEFVIKERLGEGGFAAVYRAEQTLLQREAVIKVLHARHQSSPQVIQRFLREAKLASRLDHPFAAHIYAFGAEPDGLLWIAMELVRGTPLDALIAAKGPLTIEQLVPLLDRLAEVLHTAHEQGVVHRDIKPANVMVMARAGRLLPKLLDFGVAKTLDDSARVAATTPREESPSPEDLDGALTIAGALVGSPHYMAPEQWTGGTVGPRSDVYALGALAYEALTGRRAFAGGNLRAIARAHAQGRIEPLGAGFPIAVDAVLRKAMAVRADDRHGGALELAAAVRAASGVEGDRAELPQLDEALRERLVLAAPQPLAEALAQLHGARSAHQAQAALWQVVEVLVRYLGLLALATRGALGAPAERDAARVDEMLRLMHRRQLTDEEWLSLTAALLRPYAARPAKHPLPELVGLFVREGGEADPFEALLSLRGGHGEHGHELEVRERLQRTLPALERLLRAASFVCDYDLVVGRGGVGEIWMGLRPPRRGCVALPARTFEEGRVLLVGGDGWPALVLSPLVQAAPPAPGAPEELFLFVGQGRHGAKLVAPPSGFERLDDRLWDWFRAHLVAVEDERSSEHEERAPYRGLQAFGVEDAASFFGREREIEEALNRLRVTPLLAVVGPSGTGKSSFVQAGVLPRLPPNWRTIVIRPGPSPLTTLVQRLGRDGAAPADRSAEAITAALEQRSGEGVVVLVVDQLEELFTLCGDEGEREAFIAALALAGRSVEAPVRVIVTLRDDFLMRANQSPSLRTQLGHALLLLTTPAHDDLVRILIAPIRRLGYDFEDPAQPERMARALAGHAAALPLLSFCAARMWDERDRHFKQLTRRAYQAMGGVEGALGQHAEATLNAMSPEEQRLVREALRHLVTAENTRAVLTRAELLELLRAGTQGAAVLEKLIAARLLTAQESEAGADRVEIAHEALLTTWPRLVEWRQKDAEGVRLRDQLRSAAHQWQERGRPKGLLWRDEALAELGLWRARHGAALTTTDAAFAEASVAEGARGQRARRRGITIAFLVLVGVAIALGALGQRATRSARAATTLAAEARVQLLASWAEQGRQALLDGDPERALLFLGEAYLGGRDDAALRYLIARARAAFAPQDGVFVGHDGFVVSGQLTDDGARLLTAGADGTARLWDVASGQALRVLRGGGQALTRAEITGDGRWVVTASTDGTATIWDAADGRRVATLDDKDSEPVLSARLLAPGDRVVTLRGDRARIWAVPSGELLHTLTGHRAPISRVRVSADGRRIITLAADRTVRVWNADSGGLLRILVHPADPVVCELSADGRQLVTAAADRVVRVWDLASGRLRLSVEAHPQEVTALQLSADGTMLATGSADRLVRLWSVPSGAARARLEGHRGLITQVAFAPDGTRLLSASQDGTARLWDARLGRPIATLFGHHGEVVLQRYDGQRALTVSYDGTARRWALDRLPLRATIEEPQPCLGLELSGDGTRLFSSNQDGGVRSYDAATGTPLSTFRPPIAPPTWAVTSPDGTRVAVYTERGSEVTLWDPHAARLIERLGGHTGPIEAAAFDSAGAWLVTTASNDSAARVWDGRSGSLLHVLRSAAASLTAARFSHGGELLALGGGSGDIELWSTRSWSTLRTLRGHAAQVAALAFDAADGRLASGSMDMTAMTWSVDASAPHATLAGHHDAVTSVAFHPAGALLATASADGTAGIWDLGGGARVDVLAGHAGEVVATRFDRGGARLVTASADHTIKVWDVSAAPVDARALAEELRCRVPLSLREGRPVPRRIDPSGCATSFQLSSAP